MKIETKILSSAREHICSAAALIRQGGVVGMPTETVYGLAANALDPAAVRSIFQIKGRPQDNPLIVHIDTLDKLFPLVKSVPQIALRLAERFWPGPLTMILEKSAVIPEVVSAGLPTVAVRMPNHPTALSLIKEANLPIAAPSANRSGAPSPTTASHVYADLHGKIPLIIDGGPCLFGLESTVILIKDEETVILLRPGAVTAQALAKTGLHVELDRNILKQSASEEKPLSPGMAHPHYSPDTKVVLLDGDFAAFQDFIMKHSSESVGAMVFEGEDAGLPVPAVVFGKYQDSASQGKALFEKLRETDRLGVSVVYARMPEKEGIGLAVYNRLIRAAGFEVIKL